MIAYNPIWLDAILIKDQAEQWHDDGLLYPEQWESVQNEYPSPFYSPNIFVRIGLAIFCLVLLIAAIGLTALLTSPDSTAGVGMLCLLASACCFVLLEVWIIPTAKHRGSGIDDMLLYVGTGTFIGAFWAFMSESVDSAVPYALVALPVLLIAGFRYVDRLVVVAAFCCGYALIFLIVKDVQPGLIVFLPLSCMVYAAVVYYFVVNARSKHAFRYWDGALGMVELAALIAFYASGNYYMIREILTFEMQIENIPMEWFFWVFTFVVPLIYIYFGWRRKNHILLDIGITAVAAALGTFRYYHSVLPLAWAASVGGAVLFVIAYFAIRYLNTGAAEGYTYVDNSGKNLLQEAQEQLIEQTIGSQAPPPTRKAGDFGDGQFGGGGSGGEF
jgi:hypothetical protein